MALPKLIADHGPHGGSAPAPVIGRCEQAATYRPDAKHGEEIATDPEAPDPLRLCPPADTDVSVPPGEDSGERVLTPVDLFPQRVSELGVNASLDAIPAVASGDSRFGQLLWVGHRQAPQTDCVE